MRGTMARFSKIKELQEMVRRTKRDVGPSQHEKNGAFSCFFEQIPCFRRSAVRNLSRIREDLD